MLLFHIYMVVKTIHIHLLHIAMLSSEVNGPVAHGKTDIAHRGLQLI